MPCLAQPKNPKCPGPPPPVKTAVKITIQVFPSDLCDYCQRALDNKQNILGRRNSIDRLSMNSTGLQLVDEWKVRADQIVIDLWTKEIVNAGKPPSSYAFCLAGSGARGEACPHSDLDCFLLVESEDVGIRNYFRNVSTKVKDMLLAMDEVAGLRFCFGGLNPIGAPNNAGTPELILTPVNMAGLIENPKIDKHVGGSLGEYRLLIGEGSSAKLMQAYKIEIELILGKTTSYFSSTPGLAEHRKQGLNAMREAIKFGVPKSVDSFDIKMDFYRLPQLAVKGLRLYYGIDITNTAAAILLLQNMGKLSVNLATQLTDLMEVLTRIRTKAQLHAGYELDQVLAAQPLVNKPNYVLSQGEFQELKSNFFFIHRLQEKCRQFLEAKQALMGERGNPFATN